MLFVFPPQPQISLQMDIQDLFRKIGNSKNVYYLILFIYFHSKLVFYKCKLNESIIDRLHYFLAFFAFIGKKREPRRRKNSRLER